MKRFPTLLFLFSLLWAQTAWAVTPGEMDKARAIAAQAYLRYANDGSGYLDALKPESMAQLEKALKTKEQANIKAFKTIAVPKDYASWTKEQLVEYWTDKAFSNPGLSADGKRGKARARKNLKAMKVSAPQTAPPPVPEPAPAQEPPAPVLEEPAPEPATAPVDSLTLQAEQALAAAEQAAVDALDDETVEKADNHTWIYIVVLCILVGVVVALVVFASNVLKKNPEAAKKVNEAPVISGSPDLNAMRDKFAATLNAKNVEIQTLGKKAEALEAEVQNLRFKLERATAELGVLRKRQQPVSQPQSPAAPRPMPQEAAQGAVSDPRKNVRSVFLGLANAKGFFVRADRQATPGATVFRLETRDGYSGSFRVAQSPEVWAWCLESPSERLGNACVFESEPMPGITRIVTDSSGTAVLEEGHWKVTRKARVHFE